MGEKNLEERSDLDLIREYRRGNKEAAGVLYFRYEKAINHMSQNTVRLPRTTPQDKKGLVHMIFVNAFPMYKNKNKAGFLTYLKRCVKNGLLSEYKKLIAQKRQGELTTISLDSETGRRAVEQRSYQMWSLGYEGRS